MWNSLGFKGRETEPKKVYPKRGRIYQHYKGGLYKVKGIGIMESGGTEVVIYKDINLGMTFIRPVSEWFELVGVNNDKVNRFSYHSK